MIDIDGFQRGMQVEVRGNQDRQRSNVLESLDLLVDQIHDRAIFFITPEGRIASWNAGVEQLLGYGREEFIGQPAAMIFTPGDPETDSLESDLARALKEGQSEGFRWQMRKNRTPIFAENLLTVVKGENGAVLGFMEVIRDATEQRNYELRLQELTHALQQVQTMVRSPDGTVRFWSSGCERMYGYSKEEATGQIAYQLLQTELPRPREELEAELFAQGIWHGELRHRRKDGAILITGTDWVLYHGAEGIVSVIDSSTDITELARLTEEREMLVQKLRRSNDDLSQFAHVVSHDLQAPVRTVKNFTELLSQRYENSLDAGGKGLIKVILDGANSMQELIRSLLEYAQAGRQFAAPAPVAMDAVLNAVLGILQPILDETGTTVIVDPLPCVRGDRIQLEQLFQNLLTNAIKYRRPDKPCCIHICSHQENNCFVIRVGDNGIGIQPKDHERIFEALQRVHGSQVPGTGIGLAICRKIVERHGGRIWVDSSSDNGSTFCFTLPIENGT